MLGSVDGEAVAGNVIPAPEAAGVALPTPRVVATLAVPVKAQVPLKVWVVPLVLP